MLTIARIAKPDMPQIKKRADISTGLPKIEHQTSSVNENDSEKLISSAMVILFKEFDRYSNMVGGFEGVDWLSYKRHLQNEVENKI